MSFSIIIHINSAFVVDGLDDLVHFKSHSHIGTVALWVCVRRIPKKALGVFIFQNVTSVCQSCTVR